MERSYIPPTQIDLTKFDNDAENMEILSEECAEVIQLKSKINRFGIDDHYPNRGMTNREAIELEIGHVIAMVNILVIRGVLNGDNISRGINHKYTKLGNWYNGNRPGATP